MKNTPIQDLDGYNADLLRFIPADSARVIEVGCGSGALAGAFRISNRHCEYIGIEHDPGYAEIAGKRCSKVIPKSIESLDDEDFRQLFPSDCWVFGDVLEHLFDPWAVLQRLAEHLAGHACVVACIPNAQHWSIQTKLNAGLFRYEDFGLLDRTHIRWFTRTTIHELFESSGFRIVEFAGRVFEFPGRDTALAGVRRMAESIGANPELAVSDSIPLQWLVRAIRR